MRRIGRMVSRPRLSGFRYCNNASLVTTIALITRNAATGEEFRAAGAAALWGKALLRPHALAPFRATCIAIPAVPRCAPAVHDIIRLGRCHGRMAVGARG
jgi:hypothetical protein